MARCATLIAAIETPGESSTWIMRRTTLARIAAKLASLGVAVTPANLLGIPVIASSTCPPLIALIDADSVAVAYDEAVDVDLSTQGSLQMSESPSASASALVSLFHSNLVGVKASVAANWGPWVFKTGSPAEAAGISYMLVGY